jgi:hydroxymethylpyrimidine pyrophosphatase-like HAD family hydrolase
MKSPIRLLAIDIDGTLLDSRFQLSAENNEAILAAGSHGVEVVLVTGRRYLSARPIASQLPIPLPLITSNGAVVRSSTGVTLDRQLLPQASARRVLAATRKYRRHTALFFDQEGAGQIMTEELDLVHPPVQRYVDRSRTLMLKVGNLERSLQEDPIQVFFIGPATSMRSLCRLLAGMAPAAGVSVARTEYAERDLALVDVLALNCNKGAALARYAKRQGMEPSQIMALGDNWNDLEMLELAGLPVIMGNSSQDLKERGWPVTASNDENGVAQAIRRYLLDN